PPGSQGARQRHGLAVPPHRGREREGHRHLRAADGGVRDPRRPLRDGRQLDALGHRAGVAPGRLGRARALPPDLGARERGRRRGRAPAPAPRGHGRGPARGAARHRGVGRARAGGVMRPRHGHALALLARALAAPVALAQEAPDAARQAPADAAPAGTGDAWIDPRLDDMQRYAARYRDAFVDEIVRYVAAPQELAVGALDGGMPAGGGYYAGARARVSGRARPGVGEAWRAEGEGGWPAVLERLDLSPRELHPRVREEIRASYRRWARPDGHLRPHR